MKSSIKLTGIFFFAAMVCGCDSEEKTIEDSWNNFIQERPLSKVESESIRISNEALNKYMMEGDYAAAERLYLNAISLNKGNRLAYINYSQMYCQEGKIQKAFDIIYNARGDIDLGHTGLFILGMYSDLLGKRDQALKFYEKSLSQTPDDVNKAWVMLFMDPESGREYLDQITPNSFNELTLKMLKEFPPDVVVRNYLHDVCGTSNGKHNN